MKQATSNLFLIRPFNFFGNPETSVNNFFQSNDVNLDEIRENLEKLL